MSNLQGKDKHTIVERGQARAPPTNYFFATKLDAFFYFSTFACRFFSIPSFFLAGFVLDLNVDEAKLCRLFASGGNSRGDKDDHWVLEMVVRLCTYFGHAHAST